MRVPAGSGGIPRRWCTGAGGWRARVARTGSMTRSGRSSRRPGCSRRRRRAVDSAIVADAVATQDTITQREPLSAGRPGSFPARPRRSLRFARATITASRASRRSAEMTRRRRCQAARAYGDSAYATGGLCAALQAGHAEVIKPKPLSPLSRANSPWMTSPSIRPPSLSPTRSASPATKPAVARTQDALGPSSAACSPACVDMLPCLHQLALSSGQALRFSLPGCGGCAGLAGLTVGVVVGGRLARLIQQLGLLRSQLQLGRGHVVGQLIHAPDAEDHRVCGGSGH